MENEASTRSVTILGRVFSRDAFICRLFYLAYFASFGSLFPLLAVYFKQLGMTAAQVLVLWVAIQYKISGGYSAGIQATGGADFRSFLGLIRYTV